MKSVEPVEKLLMRFYATKVTLARTSAEKDRVIMAGALTEFKKTHQEQFTTERNSWINAIKTRLIKPALAAGVITLAILGVWP